MDTRTSREFAALAYALALARGQLYSAQTGDLDKDQLDRVIIGTSAAHIAKTLGMLERDFTIDWPDFLTQCEMDAIRCPTDTGSSR